MKKRFLIQAADSINCAVYYIDGTAPARMVRTAFSLATRFETRKQAQETLNKAALHWLGLSKWRIIQVTEAA